MATAGRQTDTFNFVYIGQGYVIYNGSKKTTDNFQFLLHDTLRGRLLVFETGKEIVETGFFPLTFWVCYYTREPDMDCSTR